MPLQLPNLDDRAYADLVQEARGLIPTYAPKWTNHNPSDPGITILELFAYLAEMMLYRLNRVTDANKTAFLKLLNGPDWVQTGQKSINDEIRETVRAFREPYRAVMNSDFISVTTDVFNAWLVAMQQNELSGKSLDDWWNITLLDRDDPDNAPTKIMQVARAHCVPRRNLSSENLLGPAVTASGHVSVVIITRKTFHHVFLEDNGTYVDYSEEAGSEDGTSFALNGTQGQFLYLGLPEKFSDILFRFGETGRNYSLRFAYFNGTEWIELTHLADNLSDYTSNWSFEGFISFFPPAEWTTATVNGAQNFWIRISTATDPVSVASANQISPKKFEPGEKMREVVRNYLEPRRLLTTVIHVVGARYVSLGVRLTLVLTPDAQQEDIVRELAVEALYGFLHPLNGGPKGTGWPFGRNVYVSEIYELLDKLPGVDYVKKTKDLDGETDLDELTVDAAETARLIYVQKGLAVKELAAIEVNADELIDARIVPGDIRIETPTADTEHQQGI